MDRRNFLKTSGVLVIFPLSLKKEWGEARNWHFTHFFPLEDGKLISCWGQNTKNKKFNIITQMGHSLAGYYIPLTGTFYRYTGSDFPELLCGDIMLLNGAIKANFGNDIKYISTTHQTYGKHGIEDIRKMI